MEAGANCSTVDTARMTPLHYACMGGSEQCAKLLLESNTNVSVDAKDISGCTPLLYCLSNKSRSMEKVYYRHMHNWLDREGEGRGRWRVRDMSE